MKWVYNDGGRAAAGYKGDANDCVVRAIAIATKKTYKDVYDELNNEAKKERPRKNKSKSSSRTGVKKRTYTRYLIRSGWEFVPTMHIGSGCTTHLREDELPKGRIIVAVSRHLVAVVDRVIHDTHNPSRKGRRCVYGYFRKAA